MSYPDEDAIYRLARDMDRRYRNREFVRLYLGWMIVALLILTIGQLLGCAATPDPGTRIGPYDISLTSHRDALNGL